jgi:hypothetical protein
MWLQWLPVWQNISCSTFAEFLYLNFFLILIITIIIYGTIEMCIKICKIHVSLKSRSA